MRNTVKALLGLAVACAMLAPAVTSAQARGYEFKLNGTTIQTTQNMSGPGGCNSVLVNKYTGRPECPANTIASPQTVWESIVFRHCPINTRGESSCIGGFVAVAPNDRVNCPQTPGQCRYYRIAPTYGYRERSEVNVGYISRLGRYLWIARPAGEYWDLFGRCFNAQYTMDRRGAC